MSDRHLGFVGKENVPTGAAFGGILHIEGEGGRFRSLCERTLTMSVPEDELLSDRGYVQGRQLRICKRCLAREATP